MMTVEQRQARAIQKASEQPAHTRRLPGYAGAYTVRSATDPHERHTLVVTDSGIVCSCRAAACGQPCWHAEKLRTRLIREGRAA